MRHLFLRPIALRILGMLVVIAIATAMLPSVRAQSDVRYFPETGHTLRGSFRIFWESSGGIEIFGFPITEEFVANGRTVQWFERGRFELAERGGRPVVELGLLGIEATNGKTFPKVPPIENTPDRIYIPQTQHIIQYGFKEMWEGRGRDRIFGWPISEEIDEVLEDGEWHTVQYFERARFEYWPNFAPGKRVLFSRLGLALAPRDRMAPVPPPGQGAPPSPPPAQPPTPPPAQPPAQPPVPPSVNARVVPDMGPPGTTFVFEANGFEPGESVGVWLTAPDQATYGADFQATADDKGSITGAQIGVTTDNSFADGIWSFNARGVNSKREAVGYFRISRQAAAPSGDPARLGVPVHDQLPRQGNGFIVPVAAPAGAVFFLLGSGYRADEQVSAWVTTPDGKSLPIPGEQIKLSSDGTIQVGFSSAGLSDGIYNAVAQGVTSGVVNAAAFKLTRDYVAGPGTPRPANVNGSATPPEGGVGTTIQIRGQGLRAGEQLDFWVTDPGGGYTLFSDYPTADSQGRIGYQPTLEFKVDKDVASGVYGVHFRGRSSGTRVDVYLTVLGNTRQIPGSGLTFIKRLVDSGAFARSAPWLR